MKNSFLFISIFFFSFSFAQKTPATTDTVMQRYYLPLDSNISSLHLSIKTGNKYTDTVIVGNTFTSYQIRKLTSLPLGTVVAYHDVFKLENGQIKKAPSICYVVGRFNTVNAIKGPYNP